MFFKWKNKKDRQTMSYELEDSLMYQSVSGSS